MKAIPRQERARKKRTALIDAAIREFSRVGFDASTAKSIALVAGVATGTFYQYFENKNEILRIIATERYAQLQDHIQWFELQGAEIPDQQLNALFERILQSVYDFHATNPQLHQVLEQRKTADPELLRIMKHGQGALFSRILLFVQSFNVLNAEVVANNVFAMGEGIVHHQVFARPDLNSSDVIRVGAKMLASYFRSLR